jgi:glycosyltransferase involved in cell wall biosynthesis/thymidylate kinase
MSREHRTLRPSRRYAVICFGLSQGRLHRQPWHVANGLAEGLTELGHEVLLVTDAPDPPADSGYALLTVPALFTRGRLAAPARQAINAFLPDRTFLLVGALRLARLAPLGLDGPVSLLIASPRLQWREIARLRPATLRREWRWLALPLIDAILPGSLLVRGFSRSGADDTVYLSRAAQLRYAACGLPGGRRLVPQVAAPPEPSPPPVDHPTILFLGPPLEARGADLALRAFEQACAAGLNARLVMLLRGDAPAAATARMLRACQASLWRDRITCETRPLDPMSLRREVSHASAFLLPFRLPISEVPLVVIEAGLSGRPVIVLDAPGVSEIARRFEGLVVASPAELPAAVIAACRRSARPAPDPRPWTSWRRAVSAMLQQDPPPRAPAMLALLGVDGSGKTCLAAALSRRLALAGIPHRRVWSRFRNYLSKPLLALTRLSGHNHKETVAGTRVGYHDFAGHRWLAYGFLALQLVDALIDVRLRFRRGRQLILADRCPLDTLVDLAIDTGLDRLAIDRLGPWLLRRLPQPCIAVIIERPVAAIAAQRPDALADRHFARRRALYRRLATRLRLPIIPNDGTIDAALDAISAQVLTAGPAVEASDDLCLLQQ